MHGSMKVKSIYLGLKVYAPELPPPKKKIVRHKKAEEILTVTKIPTLFFSAFLALRNKWKDSKNKVPQLCELYTAEIAACPR